MMLKQENFRPVTLADRAFFEAHYAKYPQSHSDNTFTNMVCWNHFAQYRYAYVNGNVILASTIEGITRFRPPIGPRDPALMKDLLRFAQEYGDDTPMVLLDPATAQWIRDLDPTVKIVPDRDHFEYVYRALDLAELPGKNYVKIRSQIHKFRRNCRHTVEPVTAANREEVLEFLVKWCEWKGCENDLVLAHEKEAVFLRSNTSPNCPCGVFDPGRGKNCCPLPFRAPERRHGTDTFRERAAGLRGDL